MLWVLKFINEYVFCKIMFLKNAELSIKLGKLQILTVAIFYKCLPTSGTFNFLTVSNQAVSRHMLPRSKCSEYFVKNEELKWKRIFVKKAKSLKSNLTKGCDWFREFHRSSGSGRPPSGLFQMSISSCNGDI